MRCHLQSAEGVLGGCVEVVMSAVLELLEVPAARGQHFLGILTLFSHITGRWGAHELTSSMRRQEREERADW